MIQGNYKWTVSSKVECSLDMREVVGALPTSPTKIG